MFKTIVFISVVLSIALADTYVPRYVPVLDHEEIRDDAGQYSLKYATGNGIAFTEQGALKQLNGGGPVLVQQGAYSYIGPDGKTYTTRYIADENGFQVFGDHIPKPTY